MSAPPICLLYHRIAEVSFDPFGLALSPSRFADQLAVMRDFGAVLHPRDFDDYLRRGRSVRRPILLTFDDGYEDNLTAACPVLRAAGLPATFFLLAPEAKQQNRGFWWETLALAIQSPDWPSVEALVDCLPIGQGNARALLTPDRNDTYLGLYRCFRRLTPRHRDESLSRLTDRLTRAAIPEPRRLSAAQVAALADVPGMTIGSHGRSHEALVGRGRATVSEELNYSLAYLRTLGDRAIEWFAYPFGCEGRDFDRRDAALVRRCGFSAAFAVATAPRSSACRFRRFAIQRWCTSEMSLDELRRFLASFH
jgi:peptidoglycan/xylan/chitin deacetylase (PgdA/CDA1 family)